MKKIALSILDVGVDAQLDFAQKVRIRLVNLYALLASISTFPYVFVFEEWMLRSISIFFLIGALSTILFSYARFYRVAKFWLLFNAQLYIFFTASCFGREAGEQLVLIPVLFGAVLVFDWEEKWSLIFSVLLLIMTFLVLEWTNYRLFNVGLTPQEQIGFYQGNLAIMLFCSVSIAFFYFYLFGRQLQKNKEMISASQEIEKAINYFSTSLFGKNSVDEILWDVAKNSIGQLGFVDCVIYLLDEERKILVQKAAYGPKNPEKFEILHPIEIPVGKGIVGAVALDGQIQLINDTSRDERYIPDDEVRLSELAVPLIYNNRVIGVIDSEHPDQNFFTEKHVNILHTIASLCANKIVRALAEEERIRSEKTRIEAERIKTLDELKSRLYTNISHEFRTPLTLILGSIQSQIKKVSESERKEWEIVNRNAERLLRLINQLMDLSKLESGNFKITRQPAELHEFLRMTAASFDSAAKSKKVILEVDIPDQKGWVAFDKDALEKVCYNLISNAIKFTQEGGKVRISSILDETAKWEFTIQDTGKGIAARHLPRIFDRFYQVGEHPDPGSGVGLALTKELVERHGGIIEVMSEEHVGTTFKITIPFELTDELDEGDQSIELKEIADEWVDGVNDHEIKLLIIEDNEDLLHYLNKELKNEYSIFHATNGREGINQAIKLMPDLIVSDVMMPEMDGYQVCSQLKENEHTNHIPVVLLTARADTGSKLEGLELGADDYLVKPFQIDELRVRIRNLLDQRYRLREKYSRLVFLQPDNVVITGVDELFLKKLSEITLTHLSNPDFTSDDYSREMGMSRMQLHRKLKSLTGMPFTAYVRSYRLNMASQYLLAGEQISQIAYKVGFNSLSYFTRAFKEHYGVLPSEYAAKTSV